MTNEEMKTLLNLFDERLDKKLDEKLTQKFTENLQPIHDRLDKMDDRFDKMDDKLENVDGRLRKMEVAIEHDIDRAIKLLCEGHEILNDKLDKLIGLNDRVVTLEDKVAAIEYAIKS